MPVYGFCNDASGNQFASCYSVKDGSTESEVVISAGTFQSADSASDYEYVDSDDCNLDKANGKLDYLDNAIMKQRNIKKFLH